MSNLADRALQQRRFRLASIAVAAALLVAITVGLRAVTHEISEEMASALATQRVHIEKVSEVERLARATHIEMVERWLLPFTERARREHDIEDRVAEVRRAAEDFSKLASIDAEERAAVGQLVVAVAIWTNRVDQAVVAADGPLATHELRRYLDEVGQHTRRLIEIAARAGSSTDRRVVLLRGQQMAIQVVFVLLTLGILGLAVGWSRGKERADERYRVSEEARRLQENETRKRAEFFAGLSGELRAPLETIQRFAGALTERSSAEPLLRDGAREIHRAAQQLFGIITNILDSAKLESGRLRVELAPVSLPDLFEGCVQRCQGLVAGRRVEVVCETPPRLPKVRADCTQSLLSALAQTEIRRLVALSSALLFPDMGLPGKIFGFVFRNALADALVMEQLLASSPLDWTVLRPPRLTDGKPRARYRVAEHAPPARSITRADLARAVLDTVEEGGHVKKVIGVSG